MNANVVFLALLLLCVLTYLFDTFVRSRMSIVKHNLHDIYRPSDVIQPHRELPNQNQAFPIGMHPTMGGSRTSCPCQTF